MTTPIFLTGFEPGVLSANGGGICAAITGSPAVQAVTKRTGSYALQVNVTGSAASCNIAYTITGSPTVQVGVIYFMWVTAPSTAVRILRGTTVAGSSPAIYYDPADQTIYPYISTTAGSKSAALLQNTWYRIDWKFDVSTGTTTLDVQLNGSAITQLPFTQAATSFNGLYVGFSTSATGEVYFDDLLFSNTSGDYPVGAIAVVNLTPSGDGTHNAGTNVIEANDGTDIGVTTAYDKINSIPPSNTTYIKQVATGTGNYFEVTLSDMPAGKTPLGVMGWLAYMSSATQANQFATGVMDGATYRDIYGNPTTRADYSESSLYYKSAIISLTTLNETNVNAMKIRGGYSNDINPVPYCVDVGVEVAYLPLNNYSMTAVQVSFALTGKAVLFRFFKLTATQVGFSLTGNAAGLLAARKLIATQAGFSLSRQAASLLFGRKLIAAQASFALTGNAAGLLAARKLIAVQAGFSLSGQAAGFQVAHKISAACGSFNLTGYAVTLSKTTLGAYSITATTGYFALTGQAAGWLYIHRLAAAQASFALTGYAATLSKAVPGAYSITAATGNFVLTGQAAGWLFAHRLAAAQASFALTGNAAGLLFGHKLAATQASFNLTGYAVSFTILSNYSIPALTGAFALTGQSAGLLAQRVLTAGYSSFTLTGWAVTLTRGSAVHFGIAQTTDSILDMAAGITITPWEAALQIALTDLAALEMEPIR